MKIEDCKVGMKVIYVGTVYEHLGRTAGKIVKINQGESYPVRVRFYYSGSVYDCTPEELSPATTHHNINFIPKLIRKIF